MSATSDRISPPETLTHDSRTFTHKRTLFTPETPPTKKYVYRCDSCLGDVEFPRGHEREYLAQHRCRPRLVAPAAAVH